jgi:hypothetical protein
VASNGLIEKVRTNLILQSENFTTSWILNSAPTITANTTVAPDGTTTADTIAATAFKSGVYQTPAVVSGVEYSFSVYVKNISGATNMIIGCELNPTTAIINFNAVTGAIISTGASITGSSVTDAGNGWYRVSGTYVSTGTSNTIVVLGNSAMTFAAWGYQLEAGVTTDYIPTTTTAVSVGPVSGLPRLDYLNSSCPRLLLEPQTTALNQFSEQLDNAYWTKTNCTVTANQTTSPSGYADAELIVDNTATDQHVITRSIAVTSGNKYTASFFLKPAGYNTAAIRMGLGSLWTGGTGPTVEFDLVALTGTVVDGSGVTFSIEDYGNGWVRCAVTGTCVTSGNTVYSLYVKQYFSYTGNGTDGIYAWGGNMTATGYVQSYIPTLSTSVTRVLDSFVKTGISSLINSQEGTLFFEIAADSINTGTSILSISDGTSSNTLYSGFSTTNNSYVAQLIVGGVAQNNFAGTLTNIQANNKFAISYKANDIKMYINGTLVASNTSATMPAAGTFTKFASDLGQNSFKLYGRLSQALIFPTALTSTQLAELTA